MWYTKDMNNVRELRIKQCMSQGDLAKKAGLTVATIVSVEKNKHFPKFKTMRKLANALGVDVMGLKFE